MVAVPIFLAPPGALPLVIVDRDDVEITESCRLRAGPAPVADANGDGVVHVTREGVTVVFEGEPLRGAADGTVPDRYEGTGIHVAAHHVTLEGAVVRGFKVAIHAMGADGLLLRGCDVSDNFRQRLGSTPAAEDSADWLWPHANDDREWIRNYGAGICVERARDVTITGCRARDVQNGIVLDRVEHSRVTGNDCSFLSGWGLAMWRSSGNRVESNAFDFCVRGYSHDVYNRGQDSAGILCFEQCADNAFIGNSVTHGGDGFFGFAGREALGEAKPREGGDAAGVLRGDDEWHRGRGVNRNILAGNDFSDAVAHGIELTFGFDNVIIGNRIAANAICGIWGGYSQRTLIAKNAIARNGDCGYGLERGGVNIEHGHRNRIVDNAFEGNACGVHLWWDADEGLAGTPWARVNGVPAGENAIEACRFDGEAIAVHLRDQRGTTYLDRNDLARVVEQVRAEGDSPVVLGPMPQRRLPPDVPAPVAAEGGPIGARRHLAGREHIVMTEWGPYDWERPLLVLHSRSPREQVHRLLGADLTEATVSLEPRDGAELRRDADRLIVVHDGGPPVAYELIVAAEGMTTSARGLLTNMGWDVRVFSWTVDPREDAPAWRDEARLGAEAPLAALDLRFGAGGPSDAAPDSFPGAQTGNDRFGTIATGRVTLSPGRWRLVTTSDDGIRVWIDGDLAIDDWTWHAPKRDEHVFTVTEEQTVELHVEHFELDGWAVLSVDLEPVR